jgi:hypothetical protein
MEAGESDPGVCGREWNPGVLGGVLEGAGEAARLDANLRWFQVSSGKLAERMPLTKGEPAEIIEEG